MTTIDMTPPDIDLHAPPRSLLVDGTWRPSRSGGVRLVENPALETPVAEIADATPTDVDDAVEAASRAAVEWARTPWTERARCLRRLAELLRTDADRLALIDTVDSGNPIAGSLADVESAASTLERVAGLGGQVAGETLPAPPGVLAFTDRRPHGIVGRITAYNHPLMFAVQGVAAPLITGNAVVLKPAEATPLSSLEFARLAERVLPPGVLNVVPGGAKAGRRVVSHPDVRRVAFTGSVETGRRVLEAAAASITRVSLELGGKNAAIVFPDADPDVAADAAVRGMNFTRTNGQSCMSTSRLLVHRDLADAVVERIADRMRSLTVGLPWDPDVDMGPMAFGGHLERVIGHIDRAREQGATLVLGGGRPTGLGRGHFVEPTLFTHVAPTMRIAQDEVFGPVLVVQQWSTTEEMVGLANGTPYGLTANVITSDLHSALRSVEGVRAGLIWVNGPHPLPPGTPFGGVGVSGLGREQGLDELLSYTEPTSVVVAY